MRQRFRNIIFLAVVMLTFFSCRYDEIKFDGREDYFVFGSYYGMCVGNCVNFFLIQDGVLYRVDDSKYPNQQQGITITGITKLDQQEYELVKDLWENFPARLQTESQTIFGCPDCADGGGTYLEIKVDGEKKYWYIDNSEQYVPHYIHEYTDEVNEKIRQLTR